MHKEKKYISAEHSLTDQNLSAVAQKRKSKKCSCTREYEKHLLADTCERSSQRKEKTESADAQDMLAIAAEQRLQ